MKWSGIAATFFIFLGLGAGAPRADDFGISFRWDGIDRCSSTPPVIALQNVPDGTDRFRVKLVDLDFTGYNHGGGIAPNSGTGHIREADYERSNYRGPCPPGVTHTYEFTVEALNATGQVLAKGAARADFPPKK